MTRVRRPREQRDLLVGKASRSSRNMYITSTFLALLGFAGAQLMDGPGNGVAKSTYVALRCFGIGMIRVRPQLKVKTVILAVAAQLCVANGMWWASMALGMAD